MAGIKDHIVPWENAYRSTQLLGGKSRFVLSTSGHIQALVNPPAPDSRSTFRATDEAPGDAHGWIAQADMKQGSWWPDYVDWLPARSGDQAGRGRSAAALTGRRPKRRASMSTRADTGVWGQPGPRPPTPLDNPPLHDAHDGGHWSGGHPRPAGRSSSPACSWTRSSPRSEFLVAMAGRWCLMPGFFAGIKR